ncbi:MAG: ABC transporter permease [Myxococcota bacterium]
MEAVRQAFRLLWAHKVRSALTLFGLVWGTAAVIFLVGWGAGVKTMVETGFNKTGKNMGQMWAGRIGEEYTPAVDRRHLWFTWQDVQYARKRTRIATLVAAEKRWYLPVTAGPKAVKMEIRGVEVESQEIRALPLAAGRVITQSDLDHRRRVTILGADARLDLLGPGGRVGDRIRIDGKSFEVVGFLERVGTQFGRDGEEVDDQIWIPLSTHVAFWPMEWTDDDVISYVLYRMPHRDLADESEAELRRILAGRIHVGPTDEEAIVGWSPVKTLRAIPLDQQDGVMYALSAATLVIGGIGVLNMMLDSVRQRRREIGIRLAVGARRRDVLLQFFLETLTIVGFGGGLGVLLGVGGCLVLEALALPDLIPVPELSLGVLGMALGTMGGVGLVSGLVPAWLASRTDPALTLRAEG